MMDTSKKTEEFEQDFTQAMQMLHVLSAKYNLPAPDIIFGPEWKAPIRSMPIMFGSISSLNLPWTFFGITARFGQIESVTFTRLREM